MVLATVDHIRVSGKIITVRLMRAVLKTVLSFTYAHAKRPPPGGFVLVALSEDSTCPVSAFITS